MDDLLRRARREIAEDDGRSPVPFLVALHERPTREVFAAAAALLPSADPVDRELGARILRELGPPSAGTGRRPFSAEAVPLLVGRLHRESDPYVLTWLISALGGNGATEALDEVLAFANHRDPAVRFHVAAALPGLVDPDDADERAVEALRTLCADEDADTRFYALYALVEELRGVDRVPDRRDDPDPGVRQLAREH